jgi:putative phosphonate catabolism associated alcohol dehydrogenase
VVFRQPGCDLELVEFQNPNPGRGEALVQVDCCTICGSDMHSVQGDRSVPTPTVLGHEIVGHVVELPIDGRPVDQTGATISVGDRVVWAVTASCGACDRCRAGLPHKCQSVFKYGHESIDNGSPLSGGLADFCHLQAGGLIVRLDDALPDHVVAPASCATATVFEALQASLAESLSESLNDRSVLITGSGMLGLTAAAMSRWLGATRVIVCDIDDERLERAVEFGATETIHGPLNSRECLEVDVALEMSGASAAVEQMLPHLDVGGGLVLVGSVSPSPPVPLDPEQVVRRLLRIRGVHNYHPQSLVGAIRFLTETHDQYPFASLVAAEFALEHTNDAFDYARKHRPCRVAIHP